MALQCRYDGLLRRTLAGQMAAEEMDKVGDLVLFLLNTDSRQQYV